MPCYACYSCLEQLTRLNTCRLTLMTHTTLAKVSCELMSTRSSFVCVMPGHGFVTLARIIFLFNSNYLWIWYPFFKFATLTAPVLIWAVRGNVTQQRCEYQNTYNMWWHTWLVRRIGRVINIQENPVQFKSSKRTVNEKTMKNQIDNFPVWTEDKFLYCLIIHT